MKLCDDCIHRDDCEFKEDLEKELENIGQLINNISSDLFSIDVSCNKYKVDISKIVKEFKENNHNKAYSC